MIYERRILIGVLIAHQLREGPAPYSISCSCGWGAAPKYLGHGYAEHVADEYETAYAVDRVVRMPR